MLKDGKEEVYTVTAVLDRIPANSSFQLTMVSSINNAFNTGTTSLNDWHQGRLVTTFAEIKNPKAVVSLAKALQPYTTLHNAAHTNWEIESFYFQPFGEIALSSDVDFDEYVYGRALNPNPRGVMVIVPIILSLFILLITCFNYTNISIAFASNV